jgi:hypothetical protein
MIKKIDRGQFLTVTGLVLNGRPLASQTLDNRFHLGQVALAYGAVLPATQGQYAGCDVFAMALLKALSEVVPLTSAAQIVRAEHEVWEPALARVEWPADAPPAVPTELASTMPDTPTTLIRDGGIYFAIAKRPDATFATAGGTLAEVAVALTDKASGGATPISLVNLGVVLAEVRKAAAKAQVDLGTFTRLETHDDYVAWRVAVARHGQQCEDRLRLRRPPGPVRARAKAKTKSKKAKESA